MKPLSIVIDTNERGPLCNAVERNADRLGISISRQNLPVGDYLLGNACVEAKSIADLFQSSHSGHLWRQLDNMDANYERFFLVVHGTVAKHLAQIKKNGNTRATYSKIQNELTGTLARIMSDFECQVFYAPTHSEAAQFIAKLYHKMEKPASRHGAKALRRVTTNDVRLDLLLSIPGFGQEMCEKLLEKCGCIEEMLHEKSLKEVRGLGPVLRARLIEVLTSEQPVRVEKRSRKS